MRMVCRLSVQGHRWLFVWIFVILFSVAGCGGSGSGTSTGNTTPPGTDPPYHDVNIPGAVEWRADDFTSVIDVGPGHDVASPCDVQWADISESTLIRIYWRSTPYRCKWVVTAIGREDAPVVITGVPDNGRLPVITGDDAVTPAGLYYLNEDRSVLKVGNYTGAGDMDVPAFVFIENLDIRSGRPAFDFTDRYGDPASYRSNAAAVHIEEGDHITVRGCYIHDAGNGIFTSHLTRDILISGNYIYDNGIDSRIYEHNTYTESMGIVYEYNRFGPLRTNCPGNNLKDRSAGTIIRYNWIEGGNRQLDLVETEYETFFNDPSYDETFVYGNILIEPDGAGNSQMIHYGGDGDDDAFYRRGVVYLYHNTLVSTRSGNTTLIRLSTDNVTADIRNNIVYTVAGAGRLALTNGHGIIHLNGNWLSRDYQYSFEAEVPDVLTEADNMTGDDPGFLDFSAREFQPANSSPCIDTAVALTAAAADYPVDMSYAKHQSGDDRETIGSRPDVGAFESPE
ncbi:MAG: right-handed parallel beta-helix repeat-containing protein [Desulfobacteraceae bacterium]|nr:right-handed parallel beta-helix repeat-containing protein [Desulfobacteraceae bacterium]